jgi:hypothetical protein
LASERTRPLPLDEPVELSGEWWLPDDAERTAFGRLVYNPIEGLTLHLISGAEIINPQRPAAWVHGLSVQGRPVTLRNCVTWGWSMHIPGGIEARVYVEEAFVGMHAASERALSMLRLEARVMSLNEWLGVSGLTTSEGFAQQTRAGEYAQPGDVGLTSIGGALLAASFELQGSAAPNPREPYEIVLRQRAWLRIVPRRPRRFRELWSLVEQFTDFLSFACGLDCPVIEVVGIARVPFRTFGPRGQQGMSDESVWVLHQRAEHARGDSASTTQEAARMLFRRSDAMARNGQPLLR